MKRLNYQKGISPIIAVIVLAVILIGGGAYYFKQQAKPVSKSNVTETTNWKTYAKDEYGFEIKYDQSWLKGDIDGPDYVKEGILSWDFFNNAKLSEQLKHTSVLKNCLPSLDFTIYKPEHKFDESFLGKSVETKDIRGVPMRVYERAENNCGYTYTGIIKLKNGNIFVVGLGQISDKKEIINIFNQILSTFKFTDPTANWKTYSADDGNFQIKYPSNWYLSHESGKDSSGGGSWGMWLQGWIVTNFSVDSSSPSIYLKDNGIEMKFDISGENPGLTLDNIVPCSLPGGFSSLTCSNVTINGISYKKYTGQSTASGLGVEPYILVVISTISNHKAYTLHATVAQGSDQAKNINIVNQILSTFKLLK